MLYCPNNTTISVVWIHRGFSPCFLYTVTSAVQIGIMLIFGTAELIMYKRYRNRVDTNLKPKSKLYLCHIMAICMLIGHPTIRLLLQLAAFKREVFIYEILRAVFETLSWLYLLILVWVERNFDLPSPPSRGHGIILLIFVSLSFVFQNLYLMSINSPIWYFQRALQ